MTHTVRVDPSSIGRYTTSSLVPSQPDRVEPMNESLVGHAPGSALPGDIVALLRDCADEVRLDWERQGRDGHLADEVVGPLASICSALEAAAGGATPVVDGLPPTLAARRMLDLLRRTVTLRLQGLAYAPDGAALLALMRGFEVVQEGLDRDAAQRFASRMTGTDGLQLIVEVAHDMRSPLGSILFLAERLRNGQSGAVSSIQERQLGLVYSAAFGLSSLASDVIELARGGDRLMDHEPIPFSLAELLQSVRDIVQPIAEEKGLTLRFASLERDTRVGYPAALNRVLLNLTTNALKFTSAGSVEVVCRQVSRTTVEFSVADTGRGIPPAVLDTLFDAFRRRQRPGDYTFSSAGLGLSICQKLVRAMGGELALETELEKGTRFHFRLELPAAPAL